MAPAMTEAQATPGTSFSATTSACNRIDRKSVDFVLVDTSAVLSNWEPITLSGFHETIALLFLKELDANPV